MAYGILGCEYRYMCDGVYAVLWVRMAGVHLVFEWWLRKLDFVFRLCTSARC